MQNLCVVCLLFSTKKCFLFSQKESDEENLSYIINMLLFSKKRNHNENTFYRTAHTAGADCAARLIFIIF